MLTVLLRSFEVLKSNETRLRLELPQVHLLRRQKQVRPVEVDNNPEVKEEDACYVIVVVISGKHLRPEETDVIAMTTHERH